MPIRGLDRSLKASIALVASLSLALLGGSYAYRISHPHLRTAVRTGSSVREQSGTQVIAVFLVSSSCGASRYPALPEAVSRTFGRLHQEAASQGKAFHTIGVALDQQPKDGLAFLAKYGPFDELLAGRGWYGMGSIYFMLRNLPGPLSLPQLLILERDVDSGLIARVSADRVITRRMGSQEILDFADGARLLAAPPRSDTFSRPPQGR